MKKNIKSALSFLGGIAATTLPVISLAGSCGATSNTSNENEKKNEKEKENKLSNPVLAELNYTNNSEEEFKKLEYSQPTAFDEKIINKLGMVLTNVQKEYLKGHDVKIQKNAGEKKVTFYYTDDDNKNLNGTIEFKYFFTSSIKGEVDNTFDLMTKYLIILPPRDTFINTEYNNEIFKNNKDNFLAYPFNWAKWNGQAPDEWYLKNFWQIMKTKKDSFLTFSKKKGENSLSCKLEYSIDKNKRIFKNYLWGNLTFLHENLNTYNLHKYFSFDHFKESIISYSDFVNKQFGSGNSGASSQIMVEASFTDKDVKEWDEGKWNPNDKDNEWLEINRKTLEQLNKVPELLSVAPEISIFDLYATKNTKNKYAFYTIKDVLASGPTEQFEGLAKPTIFKIDLNEAKAKDWTKEGIDFIYGDNPERNLKWGDEFTLIRAKPAGQNNYSYYVIHDFDKDKIKVRNIEDQKIHYIVTDKQIGANKENKLGISKDENYTDGNYTDYDSLDEAQFLLVG